MGCVGSTLNSTTSSCSPVAAAAAGAAATEGSQPTKRQHHRSITSCSCLSGKGAIEPTSPSALIVYRDSRPRGLKKSPPPPVPLSPQPRHLPAETDGPAAAGAATPTPWSAAGFPASPVPSPPTPEPLDFGGDELPWYAASPAPDRALASKKDAAVRRWLADVYAPLEARY